MNLLSEFSGGVTFEGLGASLQEALANPQVGSIVLDVDSPGGSATGASVFARQVLAGRAQKPIIAQAQFGMCSAAYWFGSCASEIVAAPQSQLGSIGVYCIHNDLSAALAEMGVKRTYIKQGKFKVDGNETEPLSEETHARLQRMVDKTYDAFVADIAVGRTVSVAAVRSGFGQGASVDAEDALALGMVDRIATLDETLTRLTTARATGPVLTRATSDTPQEPSPATGQDRRATQRHERQAIERALYELGLAPSGA
jgi:capsid assembly protease